MISIKDMLGIICTEAFENSERPCNQEPNRDLPILHYKLELVRMPDGTVEWVE